MLKGLRRLGAAHFMASFGEILNVRLAWPRLQIAGVCQVGSAELHLSPVVDLLDCFDCIGALLEVQMSEGCAGPRYTFRHVLLERPNDLVAKRLHFLRVEIAKRQSMVPEVGLPVVLHLERSRSDLRRIIKLIKQLAATN